MATWPDPLDKYSGVHNAEEYLVNANIDAKDIDGKTVHPRDFETVFIKGTWVDVDFYCCM